MPPHGSRRPTLVHEFTAGWPGCVLVIGSAYHRTPAEVRMPSRGGPARQGIIRLGAHEGEIRSPPAGAIAPQLIPLRAIMNSVCRTQGIFLLQHEATQGFEQGITGHARRIITAIASNRVIALGVRDGSADKAH
jgi:hypothetical protein